MKKRIGMLFLLACLLVVLTACRGGNTPAVTTTPTTVPATTQATTVPTTQPETQPTTDNGNGPLDTMPTDGTDRETTAPGETGTTAETNATR